ncbi:hypothetical protein XBI1_2750013 [Xenorhabdus bovienii str. Intermedium]|uniref:Uncharacterized protein n=1 Tax=Xenorhabdus bovienii str. Intermedium TaxID=1379677 RepID=A0A077QN56_XENBV|nr:hypothetical protein XBI1_2750013 [Xenorhabdus bovienii str. Intermedium]
MNKDKREWLAHKVTNYAKYI